MRHHALYTRIALCTLSVLMLAQPAAAETRTASNKLPTLVVTKDASPEVIYRRGSRDTLLQGDDAAGMMPLSDAGVETLVTRKVNDLKRDIVDLKGKTSDQQSRLRSIQAQCDNIAARYYETVAAISTELQSGTTPGNPILVERWNAAKGRLDDLASSASALNTLASDLSDGASRASFLQDNVRAAYALSGAVKEDHVRLREVEDELNENIVSLNRLLTTVSDEINRRQAYQRSENLNLQTLSLAIANGELYGKNLANALYKRAADETQPVFPASAVSAPSTRPLVVIRFDRPNVKYEQALYSAISQALEKYPAAQFELQAVSSTQGNPAEKALSATDARKNGQDVLRSLSQMGVPVERVKMNTTQAPNVRSSEVRIFLQ